MQNSLPYPNFSSGIINSTIANYVKQTLSEWPMALGYLIYIGIGFSAIQSIALHLIGWVPLHVTAPLLVLPALIVAVIVGSHFKELGRLALMGLFAGIIAVTFYDVFRVPFAILGVWGDFIPKIGNWALNTENAPAIVGYSWRYIGNGGGLGVAFIMLNALFKLKESYTIRGILFGVFVFLCLIATLLLSPNGESLLFEVTPIKFIVGLIGHMIYGYVLGTVLDQQNNIRIPTMEPTPA